MGPPTSEGTYLQAGQYQYIICYEWTDNFSQIQRGQPSIANTVNLVSSQTTGFGVILQVPTLKITDKNNVSIAIFRTAILAGGLPSSIFYKITSDANPLINDPTVDYLTFYDTTFETSDSQIQSNETLYTSQQLFNSAPPSCNLISNYQTRLMLSGMEDPNIIWTSQDRFELDNYNTIPIEFSPLLIEGVDPVGGAITAIHVLDGNLIIFKEDTIFIMSGDGPNANATNGSFSNATKIPSDAGCINQNSIIEIPGNQFNSGGLMYQSSKGIYLFDRGQINSYIGQQVEQYNNLTITSAELLNDTNEVIFISKEGIILCYNYLFNRWSTWSWIPAVDSCIWNDKLVLLQSNGTILVQTPTLYSDNGKLISRTVQLPWLAFAGLQGYQSVMSATLLGHYLSPHVLRISTCYNYNPTPTEPIDISSTVISNLFGMQSFFGEAPNFGGGNFTPYQFQVNFAYPYCQSISLIIKDVPLDNIDQGSILSNINFRVGIFNDPVRLPAKNKFGGKKR